MSSLKCSENTTEKIEEAIDYVNDRLPSDDSNLPVVSIFRLKYTAHGTASIHDQRMNVIFSLQAHNPKATTNTSDVESQIPLELISKCVATLLMIQVRFNTKLQPLPLPLPPTHIHHLDSFTLTNNTHD